MGDFIEVGCLAGGAERGTSGGGEAGGTFPVRADLWVVSLFVDICIYGLAEWMRRGEWN